MPLGRYGTTDEIASAVTWLASDGAALHHRGRHPGRRRTGNGALTWESDWASSTASGSWSRASRWTPRSASRPRKVAQEQGATVLISNFGRALGITKRIAKRLPTEPPVLELDVTDEDAPRAARRPGARARRRPRRRRALDRLRQPRDAARRQVPRRARGRTSRRRCRSRRTRFKSLADGLPPADVGGRLDRRADVRRDGRLAGVRLDGRRQGRAGVVLPLPRPRPRARTASAATWCPPGR